MQVFRLPPPLISSATVKATTEYSGVHAAPFVANPNGSVTGGWDSNCWAAGSGVVANQRLHLDLGEPVIVTRIYYENANYSGTLVTSGVKDFTFWGSDAPDDFAALTYASDGTWRQFACAASSFAQHVGSDIADPQFIEVGNSAFAYRYWAFKFANNWGGQYFVIRRLVLMGYRSVPPSPLPVRGRSLLR